MAPAKMSVEQLIRSRVRNRAAIRKASDRIDAFRKRYGQPEAGFDSVAILRRLRESR